MAKKKKKKSTTHLLANILQCLQYRIACTVYCTVYSTVQRAFLYHETLILVPSSIIVRHGMGIGRNKQDGIRHKAKILRFISVLYIEIQKYSVQINHILHIKRCCGKFQSRNQVLCQISSQLAIKSFVEHQCAIITNCKTFFIIISSSASAKVNFLTTVNEQIGVQYCNVQ